MNKKKLLITTPIYYINAAPHVGSATTCVLADFLKRLYTIRGYDVFLTTGTDENGEKIHKANSMNISFEAFKKHNSQLFRDTFDNLDISYDRFIRTTEDEHHKMVIKIWNILMKEGHIYEGLYKGYYCISDETFYTEKDLVLKDNIYYTKDNKPTEYTERMAYFLKLSALKNEMLAFYENHSNFTYPKNRVNELISFIDEEFKDLCISRSDNLGIQIPNSNQTVYVWFDALINYLTTSKCYINDVDHKHPLQLEEYWHDVIHVIGKDILTFHGLFWVAILKLANLLPKQMRIFTHNWWVFNSKEHGVQKMSKSLGNVTDPNDIKNKYGVDCLRFYCIFTNLINNDMQFNEEQMIALFNSYMVNKFSNLVYRVFSLLKKKNMSCDEEVANNHYEDILLHCQMDINMYLKTLFEWCDYLNEQIERHTIWNNLNKALDIAKEINQLYKYFVPICPSVNDKFKKKYDNPMFTHIK